jgi:enoyl-CoA hydratase/carnithine racemase
MIHYTVEDNIALLSWQMTTAPMNVLNDESLPALEAALNRAYADDSLRGLIITSAKPEFIVGADLKMILRNADSDPAAMLRVSVGLNRVFRTLETWGKPTVAAINGTALGGGYELCLACHHRVALDGPKTWIGLPEVTVGLLPGGGGTQRLPRMLGLQTALPLLVEGKKVGVAEALKLGLVDAVATSPADLLAQARAWIGANPAPVKPWDELNRKTGKLVGKDNVKVPGGNVQSPTGMQIFGTGTAMLMDKTKGNYPAPLAIMSCVYEGLQVNIDRALVIEARYFVQVATSAVAKNLIQTMFLGLNEAKKLGLFSAGPTRIDDRQRTCALRLAGAYADEGQALLHDGVSPVLIQNAARAIGMPTGPLPTQYEVSNTLPVKQPAVDEVKQRLLYRQVLETVRCVEEGAVRSRLDADLGSVLAADFPAWTGGTLSFVEMVGPNDFVREADRLADAYGDRFRPTDNLRAMAETGEPFFSREAIPA